MQKLSKMAQSEEEQGKKTQALLLMVEHKNKIQHYRAKQIIKTKNEQNNDVTQLEDGNIKLTHEMVNKYNQIVRNNNF